MNKGVSQVLFFVILLFGGMLVFAQDTTIDITQEEIDTLISDIDTVEPGYINGLDRALDNLRLRLSGNDPIVGLKIAEERLKEINQLRIEGKLNEAEKLANEHKKILIKIKEKVNESEDEDLKQNLKVRIALEEHELSFETLKNRIEELSPQERLALLGALTDSETQLGEFRARVNNAEEKILLRLEQKEGKSQTELRNDLYRLQEHVKLKAEVFDSFSIITVDYSFRERSDSPSNESITSDMLLEKVLNNIQLSQDEVSQLIKVVDGDDTLTNDSITEFTSPITGEVITGFVSVNNSDDDDEDNAEESENEDEDNDTTTDNDDDESDDETEEGTNNKLKLEIEIKEKENRIEAQVKFRLRFVSNSTEREGIINDYVAVTSLLTKELLEKNAKIKTEVKRNVDKENERRIEVKVKEKDGINQAEVKVEWDGKKDQFMLKAGTREQIVTEIASKLGVSVEEVNAALKKYEQKDLSDKKITDDDDDDREDDDKDNDDREDEDKDTYDEREDEDKDDDDRDNKDDENEDDDKSDSNSGSGSNK